jgi:hypothetical protein
MRQQALGMDAYAGIFFDDSFPEWFFDAVDFDRDSTNDNPYFLWRDGYIKLLHNARVEMGEVKLIIPNGPVQPVHPYIDYANGRVLESLDTNNFGEFQNLLQALTHMQQWLKFAHQPRVSVLGYGGSSESDAEFALSCALLLGDDCVLAYYPKVSGALDWYPWFKAPIGRALDTTWATNGDLLEMSHEGGISTVNISNHTVIRRFEKPYLTLQGALVDSVVIPPMRGRVLLLPVGSTAIYESNQTTASYEFRLEQNYPNPFNPETAIRYSFKRGGEVTLKVYDLLGKEVSTLIDAAIPAGNHTVIFSAKDLATGVYFYRLVVGKEMAVRKMVVVK